VDVEEREYRVDGESCYGLYDVAAVAAGGVPTAPCLLGHAQDVVEARDTTGSDIKKSIVNDESGGQFAQVILCGTGGEAVAPGLRGDASSSSRRMGASAVLPSVTQENLAFFFVGERKMVAAEGVILVGFGAIGAHGLIDLEVDRSCFGIVAFHEFLGCEPCVVNHVNCPGRCGGVEFDVELIHSERDHACAAFLIIPHRW
jgi:hypothetical protein